MPRDKLAAVVYQYRIYVIGGYEDNVGLLSKVEIYDGSVWTTVSSTLEPRDSHAAVVYKSMIYIMGGRGNFGTVEAFNWHRH